MFTGIIEDLVKIEDIKRNEPNKDKNGDRDRYHTEIVLNLEKFKNLKIGDSISINGVCLTIAKLDKNIATFQMIDETVKKTNLVHLKKGDKVNIERSLMIGGRLDGHFVLGHVDDVGKIKKIEKNEDGSKIVIEIINKDLLDLIAPKGSVAIDGISLTVVDVIKNNIEISLIPHTLENTTMGIKNLDDFVNIEVDILARYVSNIYQNIGNNKKHSKTY